MKRWTVDARDILPDHIKHYQKDMGPPEASTFRYSAMYITALEVVHMGDSNPDAFECVMTGLCELKAKAAAICDVKDGKSVVEESKAASVTNSVGSRHTKDTTKTMSMPATVNNGKGSCSEGSCIGPVPDIMDINEVTSKSTDGKNLLLAPERRLKRGHPTTARDKPPVEKTGKMSRFCSTCREKGHKSTTCPIRGDRPVKPRKESQCSNCGLTGHRKTSCSKPLFSILTGMTVGGSSIQE